MVKHIFPASHHVQWIGRNGRAVSRVASRLGLGKVKNGIQVLYPRIGQNIFSRNIPIWPTWLVSLNVWWMRSLYSMYRLRTPRSITISYILSILLSMLRMPRGMYIPPVIKRASSIGTYSLRWTKWRQYLFHDLNLRYPAEFVHARSWESQIIPANACIGNLRILQSWKDNQALCMFEMPPHRKFCIDVNMRILLSAHTYEYGKTVWHYTVAKRRKFIFIRNTEII